MEASKRRFTASFLLVLGFFVMASMLEAHVFYAGGRDGWVRSPLESYNHWAERNRFHVKDTIVFTYTKSMDSVLVVTELDFDTCNTSNPIQRLGGGYSVFKFDRSGPFFFISGVEDWCQKGQKLYIVVMAVRPATAPAPASSPAFSPIPKPTAPPVASPYPWAQPPEYAQAPGGLVGGTSEDGTSPGSSPEAPPPISASAGSDVFNSIVVGVLGVVLGVLVF